MIDYSDLCMRKCGQSYLKCIVYMFVARRNEVVNAHMSVSPIIFSCVSCLHAYARMCMCVNMCIFAHIGTDRFCGVHIDGRGCVVAGGVLFPIARDLVGCVDSEWIN